MKTITATPMHSIPLNKSTVLKRTILVRTLQLAMTACLSSVLMACGSPETSDAASNPDSPLETDTADMNEASMNHAGMDHEDMNHAGMDHEGMDHEAMNHEDMNPDEPAEALGQDYSIYQVGGEWTDQNGDSFELTQLKGKNQVLVMGYTSCQHTCPILVRGMKQIENHLTPEALAQTEFVIATFDTERDTVPVMKSYAEHNELNDNWRLIRSDDATTRMLANTLNIKYKFTDNGDINHSNLISILDKEGRLVAQEIGIADSGIKPLIEYLNTHNE